MKIAITATGPSLDAEIDPRFGRCLYFIIVDPDTMEFDALENQNAMASGGDLSSCFSTYQTIAGKGVQIVLTGNSGPNTYQALRLSNIQVVNGVVGRIKDAIQEFKAGKFRPALCPNPCWNR